MALNRFDNIQQVLADNSRVLVDYLQRTANLFKTHIGEAFDPDTMKGRVFFSMHELDVPAEVEAVFLNSLLLSAFEKKFHAWEAETSPQSIEQVKQSLVEYFFQPIEASSAWESFWIRQSTKILRSNENSFELEKQKIRFLIASAVTFKIQSNFVRQNPQVAIENREKLAILTNITNSVGDKRQALEGQTQKTGMHIQDPLDRFVLSITEGEIKTKNISETLSSVIREIRDSEHFQANADAEKTLYIKLSEMLTNLKTKRVENDGIKKIAGAIINDISKHHFDKFNSDKPPSVYLMKAIESVEFHLSTDKTKTHKTLLDNFRKHQVTREKLVPAIGLLPPVKGLVTHSTSPASRSESSLEKRK